MDSITSQYLNEATQFAPSYQPESGNFRSDEGRQGSQPLPAKTPALAEPRFLVEVMAQMKANLHNPHFTIESLSKETGMSYSSLHRKIKRHTGKCATQLLREIRLQHARELLCQGTLNVSEVAYAAGFASADYFSRVFSRETGIPPSKFKKASWAGPEKRKTAIGCTEFFPG